MPPAWKRPKANADSSDSDSDDDTLLAQRAALFEPLPLTANEPEPEANSNNPLSGLFEFVVPTVPVPPGLSHMAKVEGEGTVLTGAAYVKRAYLYRDRATAIWNYEKQRFLDSKILSAKQKQDVRKYKMVFDKGSSRRGVCHYPSRRNHYQPYIGLSAIMIDRGTPAANVRETVVHELSHACMPGAKHSEAWKVFNRKMGGDGKRCDDDKETAAIIGHKIELICSVGGQEHCLYKRQVKPKLDFLKRVCCPICKKNGTSHKIVVRRVGRGAV